MSTALNWNATQKMVKTVTSDDAERVICEICFNLSLKY